MRELSKRSALQRTREKTMIKAHSIALGIQYLCARHGDDTEVSVTHDTILAGGTDDPDEVERAVMEGFGWLWDEDEECWAIFV